MTNPQHEALVGALGKGAVNVERARINGIAEYLAGWEQNTMREAAAAIATLSVTAATPSDEVVRLRAALEFYADDKRWTPNSNMVTSAMDDRGHRARAALEPQGKDV